MCIRTNDEQTPPLLLVAGVGCLLRPINLGIALGEVLVDIFGLLMDVVDGWLLLDDEVLQVLEELGQLNKVALDLLHLDIPGLHEAAHLVRLAAAVAAQQLRVC